MTKMSFQMDGLKALALINSKIKGVDKPIIVDGYYAKTTQSSHEYLYRNIGPDTFRRHFAETAGLETYLTKEQVDRAYLEIGIITDQLFGTQRILE